MYTTSYPENFYDMKKYIELYLIAAAMITLVSDELLAQTPQNMSKEQLTITATDDFEIDGQGTASAWETTSWITLNALKDPGEVYDTRVKVLYSTTGIYFLFNCQDQQITATLEEDFADLYNEDVVEVFLWTDEQYPIYFEYEVSPLNYELPILIPKIGKSFLGWRPWHYKGERLTRHETHIFRSGDQVEGWTAEFFIPYALLTPLSNVPPQPGTTWRANLYRIDYDREQPVWWSWRPIVNNFHDHELFGTFKFQ